MESDPNGIDSKTAGAKLDAGKVSVTRGCLHYFPKALYAVAELSSIGAKKYSWRGWEKVPDGVHRYGDALGRHELRIEDDFTKRDSGTGVLEATAVAWNALARLELIIREQEDQRNGHNTTSINTGNVGAKCVAVEQPKNPQGWVDSKPVGGTPLDVYKHKGWTVGDSNPSDYIYDFNNKGS